MLTSNRDTLTLRRLFGEHQTFKVVDGTGQMHPCWCDVTAWTCDCDHYLLVQKAFGSQVDDIDPTVSITVVRVVRESEQIRYAVRAADEWASFAVSESERRYKGKLVPPPPPDPPIDSLPLVMVGDIREGSDGTRIRIRSQNVSGSWEYEPAGTEPWSPSTVRGAGTIIAAAAARRMRLIERGALPARTAEDYAR